MRNFTHKSHEALLLYRKWNQEQHKILHILHLTDVFLFLPVKSTFILYPTCLISWINIVNVNFGSIKAHLNYTHRPFLTADIRLVIAGSAQVELTTWTMTQFEQLLQCNSAINYVISNACVWQVKISLLCKGVFCIVTLVWSLYGDISASATLIFTLLL